MRHILIFALSLFLTVSLSAKKKGAPPMTSGAPGDRTCHTSKCHAGNDLNSGKAEISIQGLPKVYEPNEIYDITLSLQQAGAKTFGFVATVADEDGNAQGTLISLKHQPTQLIADTKTKSRTSRRYISHTLKGNKRSEKGKSQIWTFQWQAPDEVVSSSSFYFAFNAGNGNKKKTGDYIYTRSVTVAPAKK
ncbi:MAG: hypothetical protein HOB84_11925 [Candidatus Marinimicrobia bacterium]|jgi:hypothetical protein|nr:hypothetical protein [Candidatus Neomarinimicrobiota bacterium]MBT4359492.1 hypothetical protein [Candidatus Neomarinimicrobiota bacterium]MBT4715470.1 hypothetical protein [Candidatus Neomarinimicrobiota bacterium]MBT4946397.1 hypothetical protein [Candidatus Neomarinimicrobiota bacterium]MBT5268858.1 hypothetical protein [Candidatus Neomarinimicrobiota bacterium]